MQANGYWDSGEELIMLGQLEFQTLPCLQNIKQANARNLRRIGSLQDIILHLSVAGLHVPFSCIPITIHSQKQAAEVNRQMVWSTLLILSFGYTSHSESRPTAKLIRGRKLLNCAVKLSELSSLSCTPTSGTALLIDYWGRHLT